MSHARSCLCLAAAPQRRPRAAIQGLAALTSIALLLTLGPPRAAGQDDEYLQSYNLIQRADELKSQGKTAPAKAKYQEALAALRKFQQSYPGWNAKLVSYRLNYIAEKLAALSEKPPAAPAAAPAQPVKLLAAGAEPRQALRLHPHPGDQQALSLTIKTAVAMKTGEGESPAMKLPAMTLIMDVTVKGVSDDGEIAYAVVMGDTSVADEPGALPQAVEGMKSALAGVKGMSATGTMSSRGLSKATEFKAPPGAEPQARQLMDQLKDSFAQMVVPLPAEAVGPGAKWEVSLPIRTQGMLVDQTATCELVSVEGDRLTVKRTIVQRAARQKIENPAMPGMKVDLTKMTGKGSGELSLDLGKLLPSAGTTGFHSEAVMGLNLGGQNQVLTMKMDVELRLEAR